MDLPTALDQIVVELGRARLKFPDWPHSLIEQGAIVAEEAGEALKVALNLRVDDPHNRATTRDQWRAELVQTAAMAIRALVDGHVPA